ncbi:hypothetical protein BpHYR1_018722 [Brachionus plicatilis]|uniref:Uncharacterized protein n=1 Tax=Brachionus plicatilis TaxID=10195 RepID=A0A3M7S4Y5_BRAPC|nr:hypothetical protein BpHYR1_018722 [Brachionus plicatilis]
MKINSLVISAIGRKMLVIIELAVNSVANELRTNTYNNAISFFSKINFSIDLLKASIKICPSPETLFTSIASAIAITGPIRKICFPLFSGSMNFFSVPVTNYFKNI